MTRQRISTAETQTQKDFRYYFDILPNATEYLVAIADLETRNQSATYQSLKAAMTERNRYNPSLFGTTLLKLIRANILETSNPRLQQAAFAIQDPFARTLLQLPHAA